MSTPRSHESAWAPFRHEAFAALWGAQFVSNVGSWMQTVGAQWLMLARPVTAYVALIQTAASLPIVLFALLAGALGDLVDRRKFLLITQVLMLVAAAALGALAIAGLVTPWLLLALIFAVGTGQALTSPTWQTLQPELVSPEERPQAISLGAVNQNLARAVGPAIGGIILAATSAGTVFLINAATFLAGHGHGRVPAPRRAGSRPAGCAARLQVHLRRTGASDWRVWQDAADPGRILEQFVVASWEEHLRQHGRVTVRDQARYDRIRSMTDPGHPAAVTHWLTPTAPAHRPRPGKDNGPSQGAGHA